MLYFQSDLFESIEYELGDQIFVVHVCLIQPQARSSTEREKRKKRNVVA